MAGSLWNSSDPARWQEQLDGYWAAVQGVDGSSKRKEGLLALDRWYFEELPGLLAGRTPPSLSQQELVKLVDWKLTRGKWRPRLQQYARELGAGAVRDASLRALGLLAGQEGGAPPAAVKEAIAALTVLKGVGPATASAVLSALDPSVPWMSDEAMEAALGSRDYTVPQFLLLLGALRKKAGELAAAAGAGGRAWTARDVERCLYAEAVAQTAGGAQAGGGKAGGGGAQAEAGRAGGGGAQAGAGRAGGGKKKGSSAQEQPASKKRRG